MNIPKRLPLYMWAGFGGSILSWLELTTNPDDVNWCFFVGLLSAFIVGIVAHNLFDNGNATKRSAFMTGVAAPNLIGGMINAGSNVVVAFSFGFFSVYADTTTIALPTDTAKIEITVEGTDRDAKVKNKKTGEVYIVDANSPAQIPYDDGFEIKIEGIGKKDIEAGKDYEVDSTNGSKLKIIAVKKKKTTGFLKGFIPFQRNASPVQHKIEVVEVEPEPADTPDQGPIEEAPAAETADE